jgi:hypothetical protein
MMPCDDDYPEDVLDGLALGRNRKVLALTPSTARDALLNHIRETFDRCVGIATKKNADYGGESSPFANFERSVMVGVSPERAILVRLTDKIARISNLLDRPAVVANESIGDSIDDAINYLAILAAYRALSDSSR